jgi:hypothetical protein
MVLIVKEFDKYYLNFFSMNEKGKHRRIYSKASASLSLFFKAFEVGKIGFYDKVPVRRNEALGKIPVLNFHISRLSDIMHMLRNEKPLYIQLNTDNWNGMLSTSAEPIGELEP